VAGRVRRLAAPLAAAGAVGLAALALHVRDPHRDGAWGSCPFRLLTGLDCPGCGSLRAVHDLTGLDLVGAASSNLLLVAMVPLAVLVWGRWVARAWRGGTRPLLSLRTPVVTAALAVVLAFAVLRNLPAGAWLAS
jgi:hypothetical protein